MDEEVLDFHLEAGGDIVCQKDIMVDRAELAGASQKPDESIIPLFKAASNKLVAGLPDWYENGIEKGPPESFVRAASDTNHSQSDIFSLAGHGMPDPGDAHSVLLNKSLGQSHDDYSIAPHEDKWDEANHLWFTSAGTWELGLPGANGIEDGWGDDVEWVVLSSCEVLRDDRPASPSPGDIVWNKDCWDDTLFGDRPAHALLGYSTGVTKTKIGPVMEEFLSNARSGLPIVLSWKLAVIAKTPSDEHYGIVVHKDNFGDKLDCVTADTNDPTMVYQYSDGGSDYSFEYPNIGEGASGNSALRCDVAVSFSPDDSQPPPTASLPNMNISTWTDTNSRSPEGKELLS